MDSREQVFADEAVRQLSFLTLPSRGFVGPLAEQQVAGSGSTVFVSYRKGPLTIGIRLVRDHGDDYVAIAGIVGGGEDGDGHLMELERGKARTDRQMVRTIRKYARQIRLTMPLSWPALVQRRSPAQNRANCTSAVVARDSQLGG